MFVGDLEKIIAIELAQLRRSLIENKIDKFAPPMFVVVIAWAVDWRAFRHLVPSCVESTIQFFRIQIQSDLFAEERVVIAHGFREIEKRVDGIEEDGFDHTKQTLNV